MKNWKMNRKTFKNNFLNQMELINTKKDLEHFLEKTSFLFANFASSSRKTLIKDLKKLKNQ